MYQPPHFREDDLGAQHALDPRASARLLVTAGAGGLPPTCCPSTWTARFRRKARCRSTWPSQRPVAGNPGRRRGAGVFQGGEAYITPSWYAVKRETGKVVPTWNYATVQVRGTAKVIDDGIGCALRSGR